MTNSSQKVCPIEVSAKLDPFERDADGRPVQVREGIGPGMSAIIEFLIQVPFGRRMVEPPVVSMAVTADGALLVNGEPAGHVSLLEINLRLWSLSSGLDEGYETASFQAMIDTNMGVQGDCGVTL